MRRKIKKTVQGFSLLELLATIFITSIVLSITGYFVMNAIDNSEDKSNAIAINNIKNSADIYIKEYPNDIVWDNNKVCVPIQELINKGYLKEDTSKNIDNEYIILTRDENNTIISNELDNNGSCGDKLKKIPLPTTSKYCSNLTYNGSKQNLININKINNSEQLVFSNHEQINAGNYNINVSLIDTSNYVWSDGSKESKTITCTIKKAIPKLQLSPDATNGENGSNLEDTNITLNSNIQGTIRVKSSNKEYATASVGEISSEKNDLGYYEIPATIKKLGKRKANTYITFTLNPTDKNNYYSTTFVYTIGEVDKTEIVAPECNTIYYNGQEQTLINTGTGYVLWNEEATNEGKYTVTIQLKYAYIWNDKTTDNKTKSCEIKKAMPYVTYVTNGGKACNPSKKQVTHNFAYGDLCSTAKTGYNFNGWYTDNNKLITNTSKVEDPNNHNLNAKWTIKNYYFDVNPDEGIESFDITINGNTLQKQPDYWVKNPYGTTATITNVIAKPGYTYNGYTPKTKMTVLDGSNKNNIKLQLGDGDGVIELNSSTIPYSIKLDSVGGTIDWTKKNYTVESISITLPTPTKTGYTFTGWTGTGLSAAKKDVTINTGSTGNRNYTANWTANSYTLTYDSNDGNACSPKTKTITYNSTYGALCTPKRTGYTFTGWYTEKSGGSQVTTSTTVSTTKDHTIYARWRINVCTINYKPNGGKFTKSADNTKQTLNYGASTDNMRNAKDGTYTATRSDSYNQIVSNAEWITTDGKTFDQAKGYSATNFCPNLANGDQTINLYVNWYDTKYRKRTCKTCKRCSSAACKTYKTCTHSNCGGYCNSYSWKNCPAGYQYYSKAAQSCCNAGGVCIPNPNGQYCSNWITYSCATSACGCKTYKRSCPKCGCSTWNDWSGYTLDSCTKDSKTQCESKKVYPDPRFQ